MKKRKYKDEKLLFLILAATWVTERKIKFYTKLLKSDKFFTLEDYKYFGGEIFKMRELRKEIAEELVERIFYFFKKTQW